MTASPKMPESYGFSPNNDSENRELANLCIKAINDYGGAAKVAVFKDFASHERYAAVVLGECFQRYTTFTPPPAPSTPASVLGDARVILKSLKAAPAVTAFERAAEVVARHIQGKEGVKS